METDRFARIPAFEIKKTLLLKVPKCEIFHLFDINDFYGIKCL